MNAPPPPYAPAAAAFAPCGRCTLQRGSLPPPEAIRHLVPLVERAMQAHRQGADETAERLCLDVLELAPDRPGALSILYEIRKAQGKHLAAEALLRRIVALDPNNLAATTELALILLGKGSLTKPNTMRATPSASRRRTRRRTT